MPRIKIEWTDDLLAQLVELAQRDDITWEQIGEKLGVNGEAARSKYRRLIAKGDIDPIDQPTPQEMFRYLRDHPRTLAEICNKYDKPPRVIRAKLIDMEQEGYVVIERRESILVPTSYRPQAKAPDISIADMMGQKFTIGVGGDLHGGSEWTQPTSYNKFVLDAYHNHGVRHFFDPGDKFAGIYGYRGHDVDLIPAARPLSYKLAHHATRRQIEIANIYTPQLEGVTYYQLGGNHDFWHVVHTGIDAVRVLCDQRDDMIYLGYDVCGVPLTDKTHLKLWHPTGGAGYSKSYKMQRKGQEPTAMIALREAIRQEESPKVSIILMGHLHISLFLPTAPIYGIATGCFEAQSNFMKRLGLIPDVGGTILEFEIGDDGRIKSINYKWRSFHEIDKDWQNWPIPEVKELDFSPDNLDTLVEVSKAPESFQEQ